MIIFAFFLTSVYSAFSCPKMECLEANSTDSSVPSNTCYKWTSGSYISPYLNFKVKKCPEPDQTCDIFGRNDKSVYT